MRSASRTGILARRRYADPMAEITNLNRFRKARARIEKKAKADENAAKHGRGKAARSLEKARRDKTVTHLDQHKREP